MNGNKQIYTSNQAVSYSSAPKIIDDENQVERTINRWLHTRINEQLVEGSIVADLGCGSGRLFPVLEAENRILLGVEASLSMLQGMPENYKKYIISDFDEVSEGLNQGQIIIYHADILECLSLLSRRGISIDYAISSFSLICFDHPSILIKSLEPVLSSGGKIFIMSNIFVEVESALPVISRFNNAELSGMSIDISDGAFSTTLPPDGHHFRHVLHMPDKYIALQDYVHHLGMYHEAFMKDKWVIEELRLFDTDGCSHVHSNNPNYEFDHDKSVSFLEPDNKFMFLKVGIIARRL